MNEAATGFTRKLMRVSDAGEARALLGVTEPPVTPGVIAVWPSSEPIPAGWAFCDGSAGTPDLRGAMLQCVYTGETPGLAGYVLVGSEKPPLP